MNNASRFFITACSPTPCRGKAALSITPDCVPPNSHPPSIESPPAETPKVFHQQIQLIYETPEESLSLVIRRNFCLG